MYHWLKHDQHHQADLLTQVSKEAVAIIQRQPEAVPSQPGMHDTLLDLPAEGIGALETLDLFKHKFASRMANSAGPHYFGFVTGGSTPASLAGDWLVSTFDNNLSHYQGGAGGFLEKQTIHYLKNLFGLDPAYSGTFVTGATMSNMVGLATARQWVGEQHGVDISEEGITDFTPITVLSATPHSSVIKSLAMLGIGRKALVRVPTLPDREAINIQALEDLLWETNGTVIVVANAGTVNTVDFDDLQAIGQLKEKYNFWLHVDAAFGGFAAVSETYAHLMKGINHADSITIDAHKWLNVPYDSAIQFMRHAELQVKVFKNIAPYLGDVTKSPDYLHYTPENSRRFRALPAWFSLLAYGRNGYKEIVNRNCALAHTLGNRIQASSDFELLAPVYMNVVCFTLKGEPDASAIDRYMQSLHASGNVFMTPTHYKGKPAIRIAVSNWQTLPEDAEHIWTSMQAALEKTSFVL